MIKEDDFNDISMDIDDFGLASKSAAEPPYNVEDGCALEPDIDIIFSNSGHNMEQNEADPYDPYATICEDPWDDSVTDLEHITEIDHKIDCKTTAQERYNKFLEEKLKKESLNEKDLWEDFI